MWENQGNGLSSSMCSIKLKVFPPSPRLPSPSILMQFFNQNINICKKIAFLDKINKKEFFGVWKKVFSTLVVVSYALMLQGNVNTIKYINIVMQQNKKGASQLCGVMQKYHIEIVER